METGARHRARGTPAHSGGTRYSVLHDPLNALQPPEPVRVLCADESAIRIASLRAGEDVKASDLRVRWRCPFNGDSINEVMTCGSFQE